MVSITVVLEALVAAVARQVWVVPMVVMEQIVVKVLAALGRERLLVNFTKRLVTSMREAAAGIMPLRELALLVLIVGLVVAAFLIHRPDKAALLLSATTVRHKENTMREIIGGGDDGLRLD